MKRLLSIILVVALSVTLLAGCGKPIETPLGNLSAEELKEFNSRSGGIKLPIDDKGTEISVISQTSSINLSESVVIKELSRRTGLNIKIIEIPQASVKNRTMAMIASRKDMPDIFSGGLNLNEINELGMQGAFTNILDYKDELPNFKKVFIDEAKERGTEKVMKSWLAASGELFQFPGYDASVDVNHGLLYRKDIFDKHGIEMWDSPESLYSVLKKLKELYPQSTPLVSKTQTTFFKNLAYSWGVQNWPSVNYNFTTGKWNYAGLEPEFKEFLDYIKKLYDEGLIDPEFLTATQSAWTAKMTQKESAFITWDWIGRLEQFTEQVAAEIPEYDLRYGNPMGPNQKVLTLSKVVGGTPVTKNEKSLLALKLFDYMLSDGGTELIDMGIEGVTYKIGEDGMADYLGFEDGSLISESSLEEKWGLNIKPLRLRADRRGWQFNFSEREQEAQDLMLNKEDGFLPELPELALNEKEREVINKNDNALRKISEEFAVKYILSGGNTPADWDKYRKDMEAAGLKETLDAYTSAQARYNKE